MPETTVKIYSDYSDAPAVLKEFLYYSQTIRGLSAKSVEAYYIDLKLFFKYMVQKKNNCIDNNTLDEIKISDIDINS